MHTKKRRSRGDWTPEKAQAWTLAFYPLAVILMAIFLVVSGRPLTTDHIGLFGALIVVGSLQAAVKRKGEKDVQSDDRGRHSDDLHRSRKEKLEQSDRFWPDNPDLWRSRLVRLRGNQMDGLSGTTPGPQCLHIAV